MRRLLLLIPILTLFIAPSGAIALTGPAARFDWSAGKPALTADNTNTCNNQATARFDWSMGQPAVVHDATATCTAAAGGSATTNVDDVFWFN